MHFDVFHSIGRVDNVRPALTDAEVMEQFFAQTQAAEELGYDTIWVAESHFSSELQKKHRHPVIPNYQGEVGINADSMQLAAHVFARTQNINFGTAIHNIVGGNGGPIASADRVRSLAFFNAMQKNPRHLYIGVAAGRFPYINAPFGILPRNDAEQMMWPQVQRCIFLEALEIFLRLSRGDDLASSDVRTYRIDRTFFQSADDWSRTANALSLPASGYDLPRRWEFEVLRLVPTLTDGARSYVHFVLGSHDPKARELALSLANVDIFNLSFTPPDAIEAIHAEMQQRCGSTTRDWCRERMPRTVLVFIDKDAKVARERAEACFDTYIEAMRGTVGTPPKDVLLQRALIGTPEMIVDQLAPGAAHGFKKGDRLMLWFEFNQTNHTVIVAQMRLFAEQVIPKVS